jgi:site-specific DNA-methyltransferase (adenine-specific)
MEKIKVENIKPYDKNAKKHPESQIEKIADSIREFGFQQPIVLDQDNVIIVGHGRLLAAKKIGMDKVPCIVANLPPEKAKAYRLADNKLNESEWDMELVVEELKELDREEFDIELTGFDKDLILEEDPEEDDDVPEGPASLDQTRTEEHELWQLGEHFLFVGDATSQSDVEFVMQDTKADLVVTDPPYNIDYEGKTEEKMTIENDKMEADDFNNFLLDSFENAKSVLKEGRPAYIFHANSESHNFIRAFKQAGFLYKQMLIWVKDTIVMGRQDYHWQHEPIIYGWKPGDAHAWYGMRDKSTVLDRETDIDNMLKEELVDYAKKLKEIVETDVIKEDRPKASREHPTMKPVMLITRLLLNSTVAGDRVLDPFGGSGSTLIACEKSNRKCFTLELDPIYADVIIERWENYTDAQAKKITKK